MKSIQQENAILYYVDKNNNVIIEIKDIYIEENEKRCDELVFIGAFICIVTILSLFFYYIYK